ncbi:hypothetical protein SELMODRAFT_415166 [Selaginella moellendorffii]|uniref:Peptidase S8/S53 domain-containing protein n=1 Tax=Selaginella moellendorffii TaxID=88036 RepID=D8RV83_SELML|nr:subtilisin-like protease SBT2.1 [Selaginella moellendorffii]EFJ23728.1 hypothetical protein SELMODRAFT_415166 [Selaginella moellendorffii]|eukprot:XP_002974943.1 subtilisin-like protease SBT2.1 [Selaginella moellendorffii]
MGAPRELLLPLLFLVTLVPPAIGILEREHLKHEYERNESNERKVYLVVVRGRPVVHYQGGIPGFPATSSKQRINNALSDEDKNYASLLVARHDELLAKAFPGEKSYRKLYSYHHLINGFAVELTETQAARLERMDDVVHVERDERVQTMTTHTPEYMGLPGKCWPKLGGVANAGQGVVIGIVDTGIDPSHQSFKSSSSSTKSSSSSPVKFTGKCEVANEFPQGSCSGKIVGARHFAQAAIASGEFNASVHYASPLDGDGHGTHTAATAAGNSGVSVVVNGFNFGSSSGMAPAAKIAVYKALYRYIGGFFADVVAAIDQAVADGVDVLSLSVGPNGLPRRNLTFMSTFDLALLSAVKAGVFVTQAVGNGGPYPRTSLSFSPWIFSVAAATHDRTYPNAITLGSNITITGTGLASGTNGSFSLITAADATNGNVSRILVDECQDAGNYNRSLVSGRILVCSYSLRYLFGVSTLADAVVAAQALRASGLVFLATPDLDGHSFPPSPIGFPAIIIPSSKDSAVLLHYYNTSTRRDESGRLSSSAAMATIAGGREALFSFSAPKVATYSSRGPDVNSNNLDVADVLKPNILAPGNLIWAAWSSIGSDEREFEGQEFALISGTSMATPHIAGIAALVKQRFPSLSPAGIASAMSTTALTLDSNGQPLLAQHPSSNVDSILGPATPFDFGAGFVNPAAAIDPGLIFDAGFRDYIQFLCSIPALSNSTVSAATGSSCLSSPSSPSSSSSNTTAAASISSSFASDLNTPYVSIASLNGARSVVRIATSVSERDEAYNATLVVPAGVSVTVQPSSFSVRGGQLVKLTLTLKALVTSSAPSFGELLLDGDRGHRLHLPICVSSKIASSGTS